MNEIFQKYVILGIHFKGKKYFYIMKRVLDCRRCLGKGHEMSTFLGSSFICQQQTSFQRSHKAKWWQDIFIKGFIKFSFPLHGSTDNFPFFFAGIFTRNQHITLLPFRPRRNSESQRRFCKVLLVFVTKLFLIKFIAGKSPFSCFVFPFVCKLK